MDTEEKIVDEEVKTDVDVSEVVAPEISTETVEEN